MAKEIEDGQGRPLSSLSVLSEPRGGGLKPKMLPYFAQSWHNVRHTPMHCPFGLLATCAAGDLGPRDPNPKNCRAESEQLRYLQGRPPLFKRAERGRFRQPPEGVQGCAAQTGAFRPGHPDPSTFGCAHTQPVAVRPLFDPAVGQCSDEFKSRWNLVRLVSETASIASGVILWFFGLQQSQLLSISFATLPTAGPRYRCVRPA